MKLLGIISSAIIYLISIFGAIHLMTSGVKPIPTLILFVASLFAFTTQLFLNKRLLRIDILIVLFALVSSVPFAILIVDLFFQPIAMAQDCQGHKPARLHYFDIMGVGLIATFITGLFFIKTHTQKNSFDKLASAMIAIVLILSFFKISTFVTIKEKIESISEPVVILPGDC